MLSEFLIENRDAILALTRAKTVALSESRATSKALEGGLPRFYEHLIAVLERAPELRRKLPTEVLESIMTEHGKELSRLGYTVSQVVYGYGAICQSITETAQVKEVAIDAGDFKSLNYSLDVAIAEAVTGFAEERGEVASRDETKRLGFLAHELRNALGAVGAAHEVIKKGIVGNAGVTNAILERGLARMKELIDRSLIDVRLQNESRGDRRPLSVIEAVEEVEAAASPLARSRGIYLTVEVDPKLVLNADRYHLISALSNLVQNAVKFSRAGGTVTVRSREVGRAVVLDVADACGGLPVDDAKELFKPFIQKSADRTGLGLGLAISRHAALLNKGDLSVRDIPGQGCVFSLRLPKPRLEEVPAAASNGKRKPALTRRG